jgi:hypothetical protein
MTARARFEPLRSLGFAGISGTYATVGSVTLRPVRGVNFINKTDGDLIFSTDNTLVEGQWFVPAGSFNKWDIQSNINTQFDDKYVLPKGTQFYVKQVTAPTEKDVYIEVLD